MTHLWYSSASSLTISSECLSTKQLRRSCSFALEISMTKQNVSQLCRNFNILRPGPHVRSEWRPHNAAGLIPALHEKCDQWNHENKRLPYCAWSRNEFQNNKSVQCAWLWRAQRNYVRAIWAVHEDWRLSAELSVQLHREANFWVGLQKNSISLQCILLHFWIE